MSIITATSCHIRGFDFHLRQIFLRTDICYGLEIEYWRIVYNVIIILFQINFIILCRVMKIIVNKIKANRTSETEKIK